MKQLYSIQYLRALAALVVVVFHEAEDSTHWFNVGAAGVDLFFVLSGFIMFTVTEEKESDPSLFLWRRLTRIVPLYWCSTFGIVLICWIRPHFIWGADISLAHVVSSLFFITRMNAYGLPGPTILGGWTLNIEMLFYIIIAAALFLPRNTQIYVIIVVLLLLVVGGIFFAPHTPVLQAYSSVLLLEFIAGLCVGRLWTLEPERLPGRGIGTLLLGVGLVTFGIEQLMHVETQITMFRPLYFGIPAVCLITGGLSLERRGCVPRVPFLKTLGDASYSIYLLHGIPEAVINRLPLPLLLKTSGSIVLSAVGGVIVFTWFERPVNAWIRQYAGVLIARRKQHAIL